MPARRPVAADIFRFVTSASKSRSGWSAEASSVDGVSSSLPWGDRGGAAARRLAFLLVRWLCRHRSSAACKESEVQNDRLVRSNQELLEVRILVSTSIG